MSESKPEMSVQPAPEAKDASTPELDVVLHSRGYLGLLLVAALVGIPVSAIAFGFLAAVHKLEHLVWHDLPGTCAIFGVVVCGLVEEHGGKGR
jgi:hypothetical protein